MSLVTRLHYQKLIKKYVTFFFKQKQMCGQGGRGTHKRIVCDIHFQILKKVVTKEENGKLEAYKDGGQTLAYHLAFGRAKNK